MTECPICHTVHADHQSHVFVNKPVNAVNKAVNKSPSVNNSVNKPVNIKVNKGCVDCQEKEAVIARLRGEIERLSAPSKVSRKEYMRDYMKRRRSV